MAKDLKDIEFDFERATAHAIHSAVDDAAHIKLPAKEAEVAILKVLAHAMCTIAYVGGMGKDSFMDAVNETWDETRKAADEAAERIHNYLEKYKQAMQKAGLTEPATTEDPLKN